MWNRSDISVENVNIDELVWYISKFGLQENIVADDLSEFLYTKKKRKIRKKVSKKQKGLKAVIAGETMTRPKKMKRDPKSNWDKPKKSPNQTVVRKMIGSALEILILTVMGSHMYQFNGEFRLQLTGGATGLQLTGELADLIMLWWDEEFLSLLKDLSVDVGLYTRFKDDIGIIAEALSDKIQFSKTHKELIYDSNTFGESFAKFRGELFQEIYEIRKESKTEKNTMELLCSIANHIEPMIQFTYDIPGSYSDSKLPVLDVKLWLDPTGEVLFEFFEKATKNSKVILASSAIPRRQKISILTAEAVRRMRNTSRKLGSSVQNKHLNDFTVKLKDSGYSTKDRQEIIEKAKKIFEKQCRNDFEGKTPLFRHREMIMADREKKKGRKYSWWKSEGNKHNAVMFVPPTPGSTLLKMLKSRFEELSGDPNFKIKFIEQGGSKIKNLLVKQNPFPTSDCHDAICPLCKKTSVSETGDKPTYRVPCSTESVGYRIVCIDCQMNGKLAAYEGETGRPAKVRFSEHIKQLKQQSDQSPLYKHQALHHPREANKWHFSIVSTFRDPLTRQVNEAVRISKLPPSAVLNSKSEFNRAPLIRITINKKPNMKSNRHSLTNPQPDDVSSVDKGT